MTRGNLREDFERDTTFTDATRDGLLAQVRQLLVPIVVTDKSKCRTLDLKDNTVIVVLGASGDLAKKKTVSNSAPGSLGLY